MTRYLDREPRKGDRVEVPAFQGTYHGRAGHPYGDRFPHQVMLDGTVGYARTVRVIAPDPKVGDEVTEDMDELPVDSLVQSPNGIWVGHRVTEGFWQYTGSAASYPWPRFVGWRIVRIGAS